MVWTTRLHGGNKPLNSRCLGAALAVLFCCSCQPSDRNLFSVRERLEKGQKVDFSQPGYNLCGPRIAWSEFHINETERTRLVRGQQKSFVSPGHNGVCYRIQDQLPIQVTDRQIRSAGRLRVESLSLIRWDRLDGRSLKGAHYSSRENVEALKSELASRLRPEHQDIVTIVDVSYQEGSAADEGDLIRGNNHD